jgi:GNAT superfamily N-acetyltransferase
MYPKYQELSATELACLTEENLYEVMIALSQNPGAETNCTPYLTYYADSSIISPMFNGVIRTTIPPDQVGAIIKQTLDYFASRKKPLAFWWVGPSSQPADLGTQLVAHGLTEYEINAPSMAIDLHRLPAAVSVPEGFTIEVVRDEMDAQVWADTFNAIYETPPFAGQAWVDSAARFGVEQAPFRLYLGRLQGEVVATNMLVWGAGVVSVLGVGTLPAVRGQGIGTAITLQPYLDARDMGYHTGVLFATELGVPVYERLGFRTVGTMSRYLWRMD